MYRKSILWMVLALAATWPVAAQRMPPESRPRAEQHATWRAMLSASDAALADGRWDEAEATLASVIDQARDAEHSGLLLARAVDRLGDLRREKGRFDEAEVLYRESAELWTRLLGDSQPRLGVTLHNLGVVYLQQERLERARGSLERALVIFEVSMGQESPHANRTRRVLQSLGERSPG